MNEKVLSVDVQDHFFDLGSGEKLHAINNISFSLPTGSFTCVTGPSGCGKTTILRMILGLLEPQNGHIHLPDNGIVSAVFQEPRLLPWRTVEQNVRLVLPPHRQRESLSELFEVLGLAEMTDFYPNQLSLGLARRVSLARAFLLKPQLLILDEPFVSLDMATAARLRKLLLTLWSSHPTTVLMVTHDTAEAAELADSVLVLSARPSMLSGRIEINTPRIERDNSTIEGIRKRVAGLLDE